MSERNADSQDFVLRVRRYDPESGKPPFYEDFTVPVGPGWTVLEGLWYVKEYLDPTLAWRSSCRMGVCGSCGMLVNGKPTLSCNTQIRDVATDTLVLAPLPNFDIVRDLVPDLAPMFDNHGHLIPQIVRDDSAEMLEPTDQFWQSPEQLEEYLQFAYCIKCGCCMSGCPTFASNVRFSGPQPLSQAYRYLIDSRDDAFDRRTEVLADGEAGPWRCHFAGECSAICPKGVDPARAIQLLKRELVLDYLRLSKLRGCEPAGLLPADRRSDRRRDDVPDHPPFTVEGAG